MLRRERLTEMGISGSPRSWRLARIWQTCSQMLWSIFEMKPFSSKSGTNTPGETMPCPGRCQRTSASALTG